MRSTLLFLTIVAASFCLAAPPAEKPVQLPEYESIRKIENYATAEEYKDARTDPRFTLTQLTYDSDGLAVSAYVYKPAKTVGRLPAIVFNRGSWTWEQFAGEYLATFHRLGEAGFRLHYSTCNGAQKVFDTVSLHFINSRTLVRRSVRVTSPQPSSNSTLEPTSAQRLIRLLARSSRGPKRLSWGRWTA
jgi:hypothetical protein